jgi:hypothetical protein
VIAEGLNHPGPIVFPRRGAARPANMPHMIYNDIL